MGVVIYITEENSITPELSGERGVVKPDPRIFSIGLEELNINKPQEVYNVGDSYFKDFLGARRAGIVGVLLDTK